MANIIEQSNGVKTISINTPYEGVTASINALTQTVAGKADKTDLDATNTNVSDNTAQLASMTTQQTSNTSNIAANTKAIANIGNGSPKGTYATLSALQTAFPNGTTGVYIVTADGKWYYWNGSAWTSGGIYQSTGIANGSVTASTFSTDIFTRVTSVDALQDGYVKKIVTYKDYEIGLLDANGQPISTYSYGIRTTNYISGFNGTLYVVPLHNYVVSISTYNNAYTRTVSTDIKTPTFFNVSAGNFYKIIVYKTTDGTTVDNTTITDIYSFYNGTKIYSNLDVLPAVTNSANALNQISAVNGTLTVFNTYSDEIDYISDDSLTAQNRGFMNGQYITGYDASVGQLTFSQASSSTWFEYFIPNSYLAKMTGGITVSCTVKSNGIIGQGALKIYNVLSSGSAFILTGSNVTINNDGTWTTFTVTLTNPPTSGALRIYLQGGAITTNGSFFVKDFYVAYGLSTINLQTSFSLRKNIKSSSNPLTTNYTGKKWNAVGDSITFRNQYQPLVSGQLGLISQGNYGISSSTVAVNNTYLTAQSIVEKVCGLNGNVAYPDADIWTIYGGVNDWLYKTPLGDITSMDTTTFYGALRTICENLLNRSNKPMIVLFTPLQSNRNGLNGATPNLTMLNFSQAIKDVSQYYSLPVLDLYSIGGINPVNLTYFTDDGVHPNQSYGMPLLSSKISKFLITL